MVPTNPEGKWTPEEFFGKSRLVAQTRWGCGGVAAWRSGAGLTKPGDGGAEQYNPGSIPGLKGATVYGSFANAMAALKVLPNGGLIVAFQQQTKFGDKNGADLVEGSIPATGMPASELTRYLSEKPLDVPTLQGTPSAPYWEDANHNWDPKYQYGGPPEIYHTPTTLDSAQNDMHGFQHTVFIVIPGEITNCKSPVQGK